MTRWSGMRLRAWSICCLCVFGALSCQPEPAQDRENLVLAQIGTKSITGQDFADFVARIPAWTESEEEGGRARVRDYLQTLIDRSLILREARARGLEQHPRVRKNVEETRRQRLVQEVEKRDIQGRVSVSVEERRRAFIERHWNRKLKVAHIFVRTRERAEEVMDALRAGSFAEVAREFSEDPPSAARGGEMPYYYSRASATAAVRDSLFTLKIGEISGPISIPKGYEIFEVLDEVRVTFREVSDKVYKELEQERLNEVRTAYVDSLVDQYRLIPVPEGLGVLLEILRSGREQGVFRLSEAAYNTRLYTYEDGFISLGEAVDQSARIRQGKGLDDSLAVIQSLEHEVVVPRLLLLRADELGIDQEADFRIWMDRKKEDILVLEMRRMATSQEKVTDREVRSYYEENRERYRSSAQVEVVEIQVAQKVEAEELLARVGADLRSAALLIALLDRVGQKLETGQQADAELKSLADLGDGPEVFAWLGQRLADERERVQVLDEIAAASSSKDLVEQYIMRQLAAVHSQRPGGRSAEGHYHLYRYEEARFGALVEEAMGAEVGAIIGPLEVDSSYSIAKIVNRKNTEILPFEEVARRIKATLQQKRDNELFARWLDDLRAAHRDEVVFFDENIEKLGQEDSVNTRKQETHPAGE